jgi:uncharacterized protein YjaZ
MFENALYCNNTQLKKEGIMIIRELDLFEGIGEEVVEELVGVMETESYLTPSDQKELGRAIVVPPSWI